MKEGNKYTALIDYRDEDGNICFSRGSTYTIQDIVWIDGKVLVWFIDDTGTQHALDIHDCKVMFK